MTKSTDLRWQDVDLEEPEDAIEDDVFPLIDEEDEEDDDGLEELDPMDQEGWEHNIEKLNE